MADKAQSRTRRFTGVASVGWAVGFLLLSGLGVAGCSGKDTSTPEPSTADNAAKPSANAAADTSAPPAWIELSRSWPDTLRYTMDSSLEVVRDGLLLRLRPAVSQDVSGKNFQNERPLQCEVLMTVRPIPEWSLAKGLVLDSVVLYDPIKKRNLKAIHMLAFQRTVDEQTVRTQFLANMGDAYRQSPDLTEGQELNPTIYLSWNGRIIIASMPPVTLAYDTEAH